MSNAPREQVLLELRLSRFDEIAEHLESHFGTGARAKVHQQIRQLVKETLDRVGVDSGSTPYRALERGALVGMVSADGGVRFAQELYERSHYQNVRRDIDLATRHYSAALLRGTIIERRRLPGETEFRPFRFAGDPPVELGLAEHAHTAELLVPVALFGDLSEAVRKGFERGTVTVPHGAGELACRLRIHGSRAPWDR